MAYQSFEDLEVWQRGCRLTVEGSCGELRTQLYIARKLDILPKLAFDALIRESKELSAMLEGLRRSMLYRVLSKSKRST